MKMTVKRRKDTSVKKVFQHRIADIRGGVGVKTSNLGGDYLFEGTPLGAPVDGLCEVVKIARVVKTVGTSDNTIEIHQLHLVAHRQYFRVLNDEIVMVLVARKQFANVD